MSSLGQQVVKWGPVLIKFLPQIIKVGQDIYALWCDIRDNKQQNDAVLKAMKLLNAYQDDVDRLLQDPEQRKALLEGLTILMNRISGHSQGQSGWQKDVPPCSSPSGCFTDENSRASFPSASAFSSSSSSSSLSRSSSKISSWRMCEVCYRDYNLTDRKPTLLLCGHTFCLECLGNEVQYRRFLCCPKCKKSDSRPITALSPNYALLEDREDNQDDDACCSKSGSDGSLCEEMSLTFEQRIEYAIQLSQQEAQSHGSSYVEARWQEVLEAEDETLARALQESEIYEASRVCAQQHSNAASGGRGSSDKMKEWEEDECTKQKCDKEDCRKREKEEGDEKCSALLKEEEDLLIQMAIRASLEPQQ